MTAKSKAKIAAIEAARPSSKYNKKIDLRELEAFMSTMDPETKVFFGADSERVKVNGKWYADYFCVIVVHIGGAHGGKIFCEISREMDYDQKKDRPFNRLMTEAQKLSELYLRTKEVFYDFECELHLDIASDEKQGSHCAASAAIGYIRGTCNVIPILKNNSWAASFAADRGREFLAGTPYMTEAA